MGKNTIEDILLDGGFKVNSITKQLHNKLGPCQNPNLHLITQGWLIKPLLNQ
jgi:hypothetical protein